MQPHLITGRETIEAREVPEPALRPGGAVVAIERCGLCGTDVSAWRSGEPYPPLLCGHEWVGRVAAIDAAGIGIREGDRAVMGVPVACGRCAPCRAGHAHRGARGSDETPAGSSAGSAAATASGLAAMAIGLETAPEGAQRIGPAGVAGVVGLKPTAGRVSRKGILPIAKSQDSPGATARDGSMRWNQGIGPA